LVTNFEINLKVNNFVLEIWDDETSRCTFYTVRWDNSTDNETDKFFKKFHQKSLYKKATQELLSLVLDSIGEDHGAVDALFNRFENDVIGLPNKGKSRIGEIMFFYPNFPLRLYALRVINRTDLVILFNGGIKSASTNQGSDDLRLRWIEACQFAKRIEQALQDGEIVIDEDSRRLRYYNGDDEIFL